MFAIMAGSSGTKITGATVYVNWPQDTPRLVVTAHLNSGKETERFARFGSFVSSQKKKF